MAGRHRRTPATLAGVETDLKTACDLGRSRGATFQQIADRMGLSPQLVDRQHRYWVFH